MVLTAAELAAFRNEPYADFREPARRREMEEALARACSEAGRTWPLWIGGKPVRTKTRIGSINPSHPKEVVGYVCEAGRAELEVAVEAAWRAFPAWSALSWEARADHLQRIAGLLRRRKAEFSAWTIREIGKTWAEADADVCEAIDFLEYYALCARLLPRWPVVAQWPGESDRYEYVPLGAGAVIAPWNFPVAILVGMTSAALAAGNTVVVKPSSDSPVVAARLAELCHEAGLPAGVLNFIAGRGGRIGDALVKHPRIRFVAFTGSREVGLRVARLAAQVSPGQRWIKRTISEMGGKNAILVDETADLDAAVEGVAAAAYGYQGQKCSACSRLILVDPIREAFLEKFLERVKKIRVGPAENPDSDMGPLIHERQRRKVLSYIQIGKREGRLLAGGRPLPGEGYFVEPTVFDRIRPDDRLAQEEIFGPVLAVLRARDFEEGLRIANSTVYGLTGSLYSRDPERIARARREFQVGNLYINRKCTGAMVGVHPFGGFHMSGTDAKAGGPDYLLWFLQGKSIGEKILS